MNFKMTFSGLCAHSPDQRAIDYDRDPTRIAARWWVFLPDLKQGDGVDLPICPHAPVLLYRTEQCASSDLEEELSFRRGGTESWSAIVLDGERVEIEAREKRRLEYLLRDPGKPFPVDPEAGGREISPSDNLYWVPDLQRVDDDIKGFDRPKLLNRAKSGNDDREFPRPEILAAAFHLDDGRLVTEEIQGDDDGLYLWEFRTADEAKGHVQAVASMVSLTTTTDGDRVAIHFQRRGEERKTLVLEARGSEQIDVRVHNWEWDKILGTDYDYDPALGTSDGDFRALYDLTPYHPPAAKRRMPYLIAKGACGRRVGCVGGGFTGDSEGGG